VPLFHCFETYQGPFVQQGQVFFSSCYLGVGAVALGLLGVWRARHWRAWVLGLVALFGLIAALGENGHLYSWMRELVPVLGVGRYPVKFMILPAFAFPLLAGFALNWWKGRPVSEWRTDRNGFLVIGMVLLGSIGAFLWFVWRYPFQLDQWPATWHNAVWRVVFLLAMLGAVVCLPRLRRPNSIIAVELGILVLLAVDVSS